MPNILVPVDFSQAGDGIVRYAVDLARHVNGSLTLLNVYPLPIATPEMPAEMLLAEEIRTDADQRLRVLADKLTADGVRLETRLVAGSPGSEIVYLSEQLRPDLIVMGSRGAGGSRQTWLGSNTLHVLDRAQVPLLVLPDNPVFQPWQRVVCGTDFNYHELDAIANAAKWLQTPNAELVLLHVNDGGTDELKNTDVYRASFVEKVRELSGVPNIDYTFIAERNDVLDRLHDYSLQHDANVLLMLHRVRKGLARMFEQSLTKAMAKRLSLPLFSYPVLSAADATRKLD